MTQNPLTRREFLGTVALAGALGVGRLSGEESVDTIIDAHTHFFDPTRPDGPPWPSKNDKFLYRPVYPEEFQTLTKPLHVTGTVVIEASPRIEDNQWILDLADRNPFIVGFVGNLPVGTPEFATHITRFAKNPRFRGLRVDQSVIKSGLSNKGIIADIQRLIDHDLELDINGGPEMLPDIAQLAKLLPKLRIVINHVANLQIDGKAPPTAWTAGMEACAASKNVFCKVSALVDETRDNPASAKDVQFYAPVLDVLWQAFGEDRLIYGSDWPVSARHARYSLVLQMPAEYFRAKGRPAYEKFFWKNSIAAYKWPAQKKS